MATAPSQSVVIPAPGDRFVPEALETNAETAGYNFTHMMLYVRDPEASLRFYRDLLGMSQVFTQHAGAFTVFYLGYPGAGDKTPADIARTTRSRSGLLELIHVHASAEAHDDGSTAEELAAKRRTPGFGHLGFVVPDVDRAVQRAKEAGFVVSKTPEEIAQRHMGGLPADVPEGSFHPSFTRGFSQIAFLMDPDGNYVEILPQVWK